MKDMKICTHNGDFHADEVLAVAVLTEIYPDAQIIRSREIADWDASDIVVDVGLAYDPSRGRYDHHQIDAKADRDNGIRRSGIGLIWKHFGRQICPDEAAWDRIDQRLIMPVDAGDNGQTIYQLDARGVKPYELDDLVKSFFPLKDTTETFDGQFVAAVAVARQFLRRLIAQEAERSELGRKLLRFAAAASDPRYAVTDERLPINDVKSQLPELLFVISPSDVDDTWRAKAVDGEALFTQRKSFPKAWRGLNDAELAAVCGVSDARFCHRAGFIAGAGSRVGMEQMVKLAIDNQED